MTLSFAGVGKRTNAAVAAKLVLVARIAVELGVGPDDPNAVDRLRDEAADGVAAIFGDKLPGAGWLSEAIRTHPLTWRNAFVQWRAEAAA